MFNKDRSEISIAFLVIFFVLAFYSISLISLAFIRPEFDLSSTEIGSFAEAYAEVKEIFDLYLFNTIKQAGLSATIILAIGYFLAKALYYLPEKIKFFTLTVTNACFSLPVVLVVFAFISIGGKDGIINHFLTWLGLEWHFTIYGLTGVLAANTYFNIGYGTTTVYNALRKIPIEQYMIARQLNMSWWQQLRIVELPYIKSYLANLWLLMFMICFNSFALVLFLGGPKYSNFEVAIYRQLIELSNYSVALIIAGVQIVLSLLIIFLISLVRSGQTKSTSTLKVQEYSSTNQGIWLNSPHAQTKVIASFVLAILCVAYVVIPLLDIFVKGLISLYRSANYYLNTDLREATYDAHNWTRKALEYNWDTFLHGTKISVIIATFSSILCIFATIFILRGFRWFSSKTQDLINNLSLLGLAIPSMLLGAGYYMLFIVGVDFEVDNWVLITLMIVASAVGAIPITMNYMSPAYKQLESYSRLAYNLKMSSFQSLRIYELPLIKQSFIFAFINIFTISLGDFSIILFFANSDLTSITLILSNQLSSMYQNQGNITAFFLLCFIVILRSSAYIFIKNRKAQIKN